MRRRDAADASGRLTSFNIEGRGSRALPRSSWRVHRCCGRSAFVVDNLTVRYPSGLNKLAIDREMFSGSVDTGFVLALPFDQGDL